MWFGRRGWRARTQCWRGWRLLHWGPLITVWLISSIIVCGQMGLRGQDVLVRYLGPLLGIRSAHESALLLCIAIPVAYFFVLSLFSDPGFVALHSSASQKCRTDDRLHR
jgi:hypothetical protein